MEFALKHVFERDVLPWVKEMVGLMQYIVHHGGEKYVEVVLWGAHTVSACDLEY